MGVISDQLYGTFKKNLESVNGVCVRSKKADLGKAMAALLKENGYKDTCIAMTPLFKEAGVVGVLESEGIRTYTDHIRKNQETVKGGISEAQYAIAALGSLIQGRDVIDERITATLSEFYIGVIKGSSIVNEYDDIFDILCEMDEVPNFFGFITGPSRTADIECVSTVGVHGPLKLCAIVVEDE